MYVLSEPNITDTLMHRYGADCFGAASYFYRLRPPALRRAIETAVEQQRDELLFLRWCVSGGGYSFTEFKQRVMSPPKRQKTAEEILDGVRGIANLRNWRRDSGA